MALAAATAFPHQEGTFSMRSFHTLDQPEARVLGIQTKLHEWATDVLQQHLSSPLLSLADELCRAAHRGAGALCPGLGGGLSRRPGDALPPHAYLRSDPA